MKYELLSINKDELLKHNLPIEIKNFNFVLVINKIKYPVFDKFNIKEFKEDNVICINYWTNVAFIDGKSGELLLYTGLDDSFVGVESLKFNYLIISDTAMIMFNKDSFYPNYYAKLTDYVLDYELLSDNEIKLKFAVEDELVYNFN